MNTKQEKPSWLLKWTVRSIRCWVVFAWLIGGTPVQAADQSKIPSQAGETQQAPPAPVIIPASEIIPRAEQTIRSLQEIRFQVAADTDTVLSSVQAELATFAERSDRRWQSEAQAIDQLRSVQRLNDILREWSLEQSQLDGWDRALSRRSQILVAQQDDVDRIIETWQATRAAGKQQALPKVALQKMAEVLREADAVRTMLRDDMAKLLNLQNQLANRREILSKIRKDIDKAREESGRQLLVLDSLPIWQALLQPGAQDAIVAQAVDSARGFLDDLQEFLKKFRDRILLHVVVFLMIVALFYFLRRGLTPAIAERLGVDSAIFVLSRPLAASFLLALLASPLFYPEAAANILRVAMVPTVIPVIRLLPGLLPKMFRRWIYMFVALYLLDFCRYLLPQDWLLTRLTLLLIAAGGCVGLGLFLRSRRAELSASAFGARLIMLTLRSALLLFAASLVSNFIGNMTLAELLAGAPVRMTYSAALIFAGAHLLITLTVVALQSRLARCLYSVREHSEMFVSRCRVVIRLAAIILWVIFSLYMLGLLNILSAAGAAFLQLRWKVGATEISLESLAMFLSVLLSAIIVSRLLRFVLTEEIFPRFELRRGVPGAVDVLSRYGVLLLGFLIALAAAGVDLSKVTLLISALGVGIGFGLQNVVNNFISGLILVFEHPVQVGDTVEIGSVLGKVNKIGFRASVMHTADGADIIIPNGELVGSRFINWSLTDRSRRLRLSVRVAYDTDPARVSDILLGIARRHPDVLSEPASEVQLDLLGESSLNVTLFCWTHVDKFFRVQGELSLAINNALKEAGIQIPFPQQDLHVHWHDGPGGATDPTKELKSESQNKSDENRAFVSATESLARK